MPQIVLQDTYRVDQDYSKKIFLSVLKKTVKDVQYFQGVM